MKTVVFVHGMYMNARSWETWVEFFGSRGYRCEAPSWPHHEGEPAKLRENIPAELGALKLGDVIDTYARHIEGLRLSEKPIIIGHSMGGLVAQRLVGQGLAAGAVCISSAPPRGVTLASWTFIRSNFPHINPFAGNAPCKMTVPRFHYTFCNNMTLQETAEQYERYVVHESRNVPRSSVKDDGAVDFKAPHAPLLFIAASDDHLIPARLNAKNAAVYTDDGSTVAYKEFEGRTHFICGARGWEEVAGYAHDWITTAPLSP